MIAVAGKHLPGSDAAPCASLRESLRGRDEDADVGGGGQRGGGSLRGRTKGQGRFDPAILKRGVFVP